MKVIQINSVPYGSTAKIVYGICRIAAEHDIDSYSAFGYSNHPISEVRNKYYKIGGFSDKLVHLTLARLSGLQGCFSGISTALFIKWMGKISPDLIHIHNIHGWFINIPMLTKYIKKNKTPVVWTFHDCWAFTGHCPHFDGIGCDKWISGCHDCTLYHEYPECIFDNSAFMYKKKARWFADIPSMSVVTPSMWLAEAAKRSIFKEYPIYVINNGIDLSVFCPVESNFRHRYHCDNNYILLGVAFGWSNKKGLDVFSDLAKRLDKSYRIVLVGTDPGIDKLLPENVISIHRTQDPKELAEIYSAADLFINPTREDNYPTVNLESLACGTPVLTFKTGGSPEMLTAMCGSVVERNDIEKLITEIERICKTHPYSRQMCVDRAKSFSTDECYTKYIKLYEEMVNDRTSKS